MFHIRYVVKEILWTAHVVEEKFKEAMGGVLFIDEAYALVDDSNTFGAGNFKTVQSNYDGLCWS